MTSNVKKKCPDCGGTLRTRASVTEMLQRDGGLVPNPNFGRAYQSCSGQGCKYFRWLDGPTTPVAVWPDCVTEPLLKRVAKTACRAYDRSANDPVQFTSAGFSKAFCKLTGLKQPLDGGVVTSILLGRWWIKSLKGCHWRIVEDSQDCHTRDQYRDEETARLGATYDAAMARWADANKRLRSELAFERQNIAATEESRDTYLVQRDKARQQLAEHYGKIQELENALADYQDQDHIGATTQEHETALARVAQLEREAQQHTSWATNETRQLWEAKDKLKDLTLGLPDCFEDLVREIRRLRAVVAATPRDLAIPEYRAMLKEARDQYSVALDELRWLVDLDQLKHKTAKERLQKFLAAQAAQQDDDPEPLL